MEGYHYDDQAHYHTLDGKPLIGTSTLANVLAKPGLTWWASGLCAERFGWTHPGNAKDGWVSKDVRIKYANETREKIDFLDDDEYLKLVDGAYRAHTTQLHSAAISGTDMHAVMERYVKACIDKNAGVPLKGSTVDPKLALFVTWALSHVKRFLWSEVNCYSREYWLGGISDCGYEDLEGKVAILDFKSSKEAYTSQFWQCVGYAIQIEENGGYSPGGVKVLEPVKIDYVAVLPFGMDKPEVKYYYNMSKGKEAVNAMLLLYKELNK